MRLNKILMTGLLICGLHAMEDQNKDKFDYKMILKLTQKNDSDTDSIGHFDELHDNIFKTYLDKKYQNLYKFQRLMLIMTDIYDDYAESNLSDPKNVEKFLEKNNDNALPKELKKAWFEIFIKNGCCGKSIEERLYGNKQ